MENKFFKIAQDILKLAADGGLRPEQAVDIAGREAGGNINCYPGVAGHECYPLAVFVALEGKLKRGSRWPYNFEGILQAMVQHVQGACPDVTKDVVLITDSWWAPNFEKWQGNINAIIKSGINVEIYLLSYPDVINLLQV
jgi:hypothetical protein